MFLEPEVLDCDILPPPLSDDTWDAGSAESAAGICFRSPYCKERGDLASFATSLENN